MGAARTVGLRSGGYNGVMHWFETRHPDSGERLVVELTGRRAYRGRRDRYGAPEEPDEPEMVEIVRVSDEKGREIDVTPIEAYLEKEVARRWRSGPWMEFF